MFTDLRKKIRLLQPERRKNSHLRKAFRQLQEISKTSFDYYSEVYRTQKIVENLYDVERKRSVTMHGILSALEILIDKKLSFNDQMDKILKILIKTTKGDRSFLFKKCIGFDDCMELVNYSGEFDLLYEDNKSTFIKYPGFHEFLLSDSSLFLNKNELSEEELSYLPDGLISLCGLPIINKGKKWGLLGMSIYTPDKEWDEYDKLVLNSFGNIVTGILDCQPQGIKNGRLTEKHK